LALQTTHESITGGGSRRTIIRHSVREAFYRTSKNMPYHNTHINAGRDSLFGHGTIKVGNTFF